VLSVRMSRLRDDLVAKIEAQRSESNMVDALVGISEAIQSVVSSVDDVTTVAMGGSDPQDAAPTLGAKRAARDIIGGKTRSIDTKVSRMSLNAALVHRDKPAAREDAAHSSAFGTEGATCASDIKQAILVVLGQA